MKSLKIKIAVVLNFCLMTTVFSFAQKADEKAILTVLEEENNAWQDKNLEAWKKHWSHTDYVKSVFSSSYYFDNTMSWDSLKASMKTYFESKQPGMSVERGESKVFVNGEFAVATQNGIFNNDRAVFPFEPMELERTVYLEKNDGIWKIYGEHIYDLSSFKPNDKNAEMYMNIAGYYHLWQKNIDAAIKVFSLNTELFPEEFNTWDSLAEAYMMMGDKEKAIKYYKKSLELNPKNNNATAKLAELTE